MYGLMIEYTWCRAIVAGCLAIGSKAAMFLKSGGSAVKAASVVVSGGGAAAAAAAAAYTTSQPRSD